MKRKRCKKWSAIFATRDGKTVTGSTVDIFHMNIPGEWLPLVYFCNYILNSSNASAALHPVTNSNIYNFSNDPHTSHLREPLPCKGFASGSIALMSANRPCSVRDKRLLHLHQQKESNWQAISVCRCLIQENCALTEAVQHKDRNHIRGIATDDHARARPPAQQSVTFANARQAPSQSEREISTHHRTATAASTVET